MLTPRFPPPFYHQYPSFNRPNFLAFLRAGKPEAALANMSFDDVPVGMARMLQCIEKMLEPGNTTFIGEKEKGN